MQLTYVKWRNIIKNKATALMSSSEADCECPFYFGRKILMFGRKKKKQSKDMTYFYLDALKNKQIPVLVLDPKWHELFPDFRKTDKIKKLEEHLLILSSSRDSPQMI